MKEFSGNRHGNRRDFLQWLRNGAVVLTGGTALAGCGGGGSGSSSPVASGRFVDGSVVLPAGSSLLPGSLVVQTALGTSSSVQSTGAFRADVSKTIGQIVVATDKQSRPIYKGITFPSAGAIAEPLQIDSLSTAAVLMMLAPGICPTTDPAITRQAYAAIKSQAEVVMLAGIIDAVIAGVGFLDILDVGFQKAMNSALQAVSSALIGSMAASRGVVIYPNAPTDGLTLTVPDPVQSPQSLHIENGKKRPVAFYSRMNSDPYVGVVGSAQTRNPTNFNDLIEIYKDPSHAIFAAATTDFPVSFGNKTGTYITGYGSLPLGLARLITSPITSAGQLLDPNFRQALDARWTELKKLDDAGELSRLVGPTLQALLFDVVLPVVSLVLGISSDENARRGLLVSVGQSVNTNVLDMLRAVVAKDPIAALGHFTSLISDTIQASLEYIASVLVKSIAKTILEDFTGIVKIVDDVYAVVDMARFDYDTTNTPMITVFHVNFTGDAGVVLRSASIPSLKSQRHSGEQL